MSNTVSGSCICCRGHHEELFKWKVWLYGEWWWLWLCQGCRDMDREPLTKMIRWNLENLPILDDEPQFPPEMYGAKAVRERSVYGCH
jgi:hypothetical protein